MRYQILSVAVLLLTVTVSLPVHAQAVPPVVQNNAHELLKECDGDLKAAHGKALQSADLNGDGILDWVLDAGELACEAPSYYCGTAGCTLMIFVSKGQEHEIAWRGNALGWKQAKVQGKPGVRFDLHGSACNRSGHLGCVQNYVFQGSRLVRAR